MLACLLHVIGFKIIRFNSSNLKYYKCSSIMIFDNILDEIRF